MINLSTICVSQLSTEYFNFVQAMREIIYYVANSLDGFIAGEQDDISGFVSGGNGVEQYFSDLAGFDTVIVGKNTYEFGYKFGLQPGQPAYPHMQHYIFSNQLELAEKHEKVQIKKMELAEIDAIQKRKEHLFTYAEVVSLRPGYWIMKKLVYSRLS